MRCFPPDLCTAQPVRSAKYAPLPNMVPAFDPALAMRKPSSLIPSALLGEVPWKR